MSLAPMVGVDYLIDYYEILGIDRTALPEDVTSAWRTKVKQYHPDRMQGLAPELISTAKQRLSLINEAHGILGNEESRGQYDETLTQWTKPISTDGRAIIDLTGAGGFSFSGLLEHITETDEERENQAEQIAKDLSGFSPATYEFFQIKADSEAGIPPALLPAYLEQLRCRDLYLQMKESFIWDSLGLSNVESKGVLGYVQAASLELERIRGLANIALENEVLLLTTGKKTLLPAPETSGALVVTELFKHHNERLEVHFARQEERLKVVTEEREVVLKQIFESGSQITYHPHVTNYSDLLVVEMIFPSKTMRLCFKITEGNAEGLEIEGLDDLDDFDTACAWINNGYTIVSFKPQPDIDTKDELAEVITRHGTLLFKDKAE